MILLLRDHIKAYCCNKKIYATNGENLPNYSTNFDHYTYTEYFAMNHNENSALATIDGVEGMGFTKYLS